MSWPVGITRLNYLRYITITPTHWKDFHGRIPHSLKGLDMELDKKLYPSRSKPARDPKETLKLIGSDIDIFRKVNDLIRKGEHYETAIYTIAGNPKSFETVKKIYNTYTWWAHRFAGKLTSAPFRAFRGRPPNDPRRRFVQALLRDAYSPKRKTGALIAKEWESFYSYLNVCLEILKSHLY